MRKNITRVRTFCGRASLQPFITTVIECHFGSTGICRELPYLRYIGGKNGRGGENEGEWIDRRTIKAICNKLLASPPTPTPTPSPQESSFSLSPNPFYIVWSDR